MRLPSHGWVSIRITKISWVDDVNISLLYNLYKDLSTLLLGLVKNCSQFSAWSNISGMKIRLGLSYEVDCILIPLSSTSSLSLYSDPSIKCSSTSSNMGNGGEPESVENSIQ